MDILSAEMKIIIPKGCDNAPRKQIIIDFTVAILKQQKEIVEKYADESIVWFQLKENKKIESLSALIIDFCDVYMFSNTAKSGKVKEIKSYKVA